MKLVLMITLCLMTNLGIAKETPKYSKEVLNGEISSKYIDDVFKRVARENDVPEVLLKAICWNESKNSPDAYNLGDGSGNNHAFGICQVLHSTARSYGFQDTNCYGDFSDVVNADGYLIKTSRVYKDCKLFGVYTNITFAAKYLKDKLDQYDDSWVSAIASYNSGSPKVCKTGFLRRKRDHSIIARCVKGELANKYYVDLVMKTIASIAQRDKFLERIPQ